jgi:D-tagatose-1,6-bisphosphate aldolase subunit GatZ/KbaZ
LPETLISQHLATAWPEVMAGSTTPTAPALVQAAVIRVLRAYANACE